MRDDVVDRVRAIAGRIGASYGLDIFDVQFRREGRGMVLRVQIDRPGASATEQDSVGIDDCAHVSRDLSAALDVEDFVPEGYTLEVSSPGLDRPLNGASDFDRFSGRRAKVVMREAVDGQMFFKGRLQGVTRATGQRPAVVIVTDDDRQHVVPLDVITRANLEVEF